MAKSNKKSSKQQRLEQQKKAKQRTILRIGGFALLAIVIMGSLFVWRNAGQAEADALAQTTPPNRVGNADAPVQIVEYGDFGCHACRAWHNAGTKETLLAEFGDAISFEFRHFPVITAQSPQAAEAGQCAAEQDAFWAYHDHIYEQTQEGALSTSDLKNYATAVNLEQTSFDACLDSGKYRELVDQQRIAASRAGAQGTPTFLINGQQVFPSLQAMTAVIQAELQ